MTPCGAWAGALQHVIGPAVIQLVAFCRTFGLPCADLAGAVDCWTQALERLPADLAREAVQTVTRTWRWSGKLPLPADLEAAIADELGRRRAAQHRLETAERCARRGQIAAPVTAGTARASLPAAVKAKLDAFLARHAAVPRRRRADDIDTETDGPVLLVQPAPPELIAAWMQACGAEDSGPPVVPG